MRKTVALQLLGPVSLFGVMAIAEVAAYALNCAPSSEWLWYFNLKWFALFQQSQYALEAALGGGAQILVVGAPLLILAGLGVAFRRTLLLAMSSNLTLAYVVFAALTWVRATAPLQASLSVQFAVSTHSELILLAALVSLCLLSFAVSHLIYLQKVITHTA
jgi:hypothetical protein